MTQVLLGGWTVQSDNPLVEGRSLQTWTCASGLHETTCGSSQAQSHYCKFGTVVCQIGELNQRCLILGSWKSCIYLTFLVFLRTLWPALTPSSPRGRSVYFIHFVDNVKSCLSAITISSWRPIKKITWCFWENRIHNGMFKCPQGKYWL